MADVEEAPGGPLAVDWDRLFAEEERPPGAPDSTPFWRLRHDDLAAALGRRDLSGEQLRVYLALADLTRGFGKDRDVVSIGQIARAAGGLRRPHASRALGALSAKGLCGQSPAKGQSVVRWAIWPAPSVPPEGNSAAPVPSRGNRTVPSQGNETVPKAVPSPGKHQDTKKGRKTKKCVRAGAAGRTGARGEGTHTPAAAGGSRGASAQGAGQADRSGTDAKSDDGAAVGRITSLWRSGYKLRLGRPCPPMSERQAETMIRRLLADIPEGELTRAVGRWWGADRASYGPGLFERKLCDGDADLTGRAVKATAPAGKAGYNRAATSVRYSDTARRFQGANR